MPIYEYSKGGINIGLSDPIKGNILVYLKSEKFDVAGVEVSLGAKTKEGFDPILSAVTTPKGIANLGKSDKISKLEGPDIYSLHLSGLKKKIK